MKQQCTDGWVWLTIIELIGLLKLELAKYQDGLL